MEIPMNLITTNIPDIKVFKPRRFGDARGWFSEVWHEQRLEGAGITAQFVQDNMALSTSVGTIRGLHFQHPPMAQGKLIFVVTGRLLDIVVDIRKGSPTFGQHVAAELSAEGGEQLWVPAGFAHGYCTLEADTRIFYKVTNYYDPKAEDGIRFDDATLGIDWPIDLTKAVVSDKDRVLPALNQLPTAFLYGVDA